jgi:group I intron endonuclease
MLKHFWELRLNKHFNQHFQLAFNKYGKDNFEFRILEKIEVGLLDVKERLWISHYRSNQPEFGYNLDSGGGYFRYRSKETCRKISESNTGKHRSKESCRRIRDVVRGRKYSIEARRNMSNAHKGKKHSIETRLKMSKSKSGCKNCNFGVHFSEERRCRMSEARIGKPRWKKLKETQKQPQIPEKV